MKKYFSVFISLICVLSMLIMNQQEAFAKGKMDTAVENEVNKTKTISGKMIRPEHSVISPSTLLSIKAIRIIDGKVSDIAGETTILMKNNEEVDFEITVPDDGSDQRYILKYGPKYKEEKVKDMRFGYYNKNGGVYKESNAAIIDLNKGEGKDLVVTFAPVKKISGRISLLNGDVVTRPSHIIRIRAIQEEKEKIYIINKTGMTIKKGETFADYSIYVPLWDEKNAEYKIQYELGGFWYDFSNRNKKDYIKAGYYNDKETTPYKNQATLIKVTDEDIENIDMEIIEGKRVSGRLSIPKNNFIYPTIALENINDEYYVEYEVRERVGENSVDYSLIIPCDENAQYIISYVFNNDKYVNIGYYNSEKTTYLRELATIVKGSNTNITDINMELIKGRKISGKMLFPDNDEKPGASHIDVKITASNIKSNESFSKDIKLSWYGRKRINYYIVVPRLNNPKDYIIDYEVINIKCPGENERYIKKGYYNSNKTVYNLEDAELIRILDKDVEDINLTLLPVRTEEEALIDDFKIEYIKPIDELEGFTVGEDAEIIVRVTNIGDEEREASLIIGFYNQKNRLINYAEVNSKIKAKESADLKKIIKILEDGKKVKCFIWNNLDEMIPLEEVLERQVKQ